MANPKVFLTQEEEYDLVTKAQAGDITARNTLIERNSGFLWDQCQKYADRHGGYAEDYFGQSSIAYMRCIRKFDTSRGLRLSTLAGVVIQNCLRTNSRNEAHLIRVPTAAQVAVSRGKPASREIMESAKVAMEAPKLVVPTTPVFVNDYVPARDKLDRGLRRVVAKIKNPLSKQVVEMVLNKMTFSEIGVALGIHHQRVSRRYAAAVAEMRSILGVHLEEAPNNAQGGANAVQQPNSQSPGKPRQRRTRHRPSGDCTG